MSTMENISIEKLFRVDGDVALITGAGDGFGRIASLALAAAGAFFISLIKPQFEVGKGRVGKGGIVRDPALHEEVCRRIEGWLDARPGWRVLGVTDSPIEGAEGNKEFLIAAARDAE